MSVFRRVMRLIAGRDGVRPERSEVDSRTHFGDLHDKLDDVRGGDEPTGSDMPPPRVISRSKGFMQRSDENGKRWADQKKREVSGRATAARARSGGMGPFRVSTRAKTDRMTALDSHNE